MTYQPTETVIRAGTTELVVTDPRAEDALTLILEELRTMNLRLSVIAETDIREQ